MHGLECAHVTSADTHRPYLAAKEPGKWPVSGLPCARLKPRHAGWREWIPGRQLPLSVITFQGFFLARSRPPNTHPTLNPPLLKARYRAPGKTLATVHSWYRHGTLQQILRLQPPGSKRRLRGTWVKTSCSRERLPQTNVSKEPRVQRWPGLYVRRGWLYQQKLGSPGPKSRPSRPDETLVPGRSRLIRALTGKDRAVPP